MKTTVHIGYPKTGTTFLQKAVFPNLRQYKYFDYHASENFLKPLIYHNKEAVEQVYTDLTSLKTAGELPMLFSYEGLTGNAFDSTSAGAVEIAQRLKNAGVDKIIITLRNQYTAIDSMYRQFVQQGGTMSFKAWISYGKKPGFDSTYFNYSAVVNTYFNLFGSKNVLVILQEDLKKNGHEVLQRLCHFLETELLEQTGTGKKSANKSLSDASIELLRFSNRYTHNYFNKPGVFGPRFTTWKIRQALQKGIDPWLISRFSGKKNFLERSKTTIGELYSQSNRKLQKLTSLPLSRYGYPM